MTRSFLPGVLAVALAAAPSFAAATLPPPADPRTALAAGLARAQARGTNAALILFIARNPVSGEAGEARRQLAARPHLDPVPYPGADGAILEAFDRARLAGTAGLAAFAARYRDAHPLGTEALNPAWAAGRR